MVATRYKVLHEGNITTVSTVPFVVAAGTANAITANFTPDITLTDGLLIKVRASGANTVTNPTIAVDGGSALTIYKNGNQALVAGDIYGSGYDMLLLYTSATTRWELLNPSTSVNLYGGNIKHYNELVNALGSTSGATSIDLTAGSVVSATIGAATTFSVTNPPASGYLEGFIFYLTNGGAYTITWMSGTKWAGGSAPALTSSGLDILVFETKDGGTTWYGHLAAKDIK